MRTTAPRRRRATTAPRRDSRGGALRLRARQLGWHLGQGAWIVLLSALIALHFVWGVLLGLRDGVGMLRRAWAGRRDPDPPALPPPAGENPAQVAQTHVLRRETASQTARLG